MPKHGPLDQDWAQIYVCPNGSLDEIWIYDPNGSEITIRGIRSQIHFLGSPHMTHPDPAQMTERLGLIKQVASSGELFSGAIYSMRDLIPGS